MGTHLIDEWVQIKVGSKVALYDIDRAVAPALIVCMPRRQDVLLPTVPPRGLSRVQAAMYIGVSPSLFDEMVKDGRMPKPVRINARTVWDRMKLDEAFASLSDIGIDHDDPWSKAAV